MCNKHCNPKDHELWNRRSFLKALGMSGAGTLAFANSNLQFTNNSRLTAAINDAETENILVIVRLFGGNDGLNTIVPLSQYDLYANARPRLKLAENTLWKPTTDFGFNKNMAALESLWDEGGFKVINSVGYQDQSQSHFKGTSIWSAGSANPSENTGWLGRYFEGKYEDYLSNPPEFPTAIEVSAGTNTTFEGTQSRYSFSASNIDNLRDIAQQGVAYSLEGIPDNCTAGEKLKFVRGLFSNTYAYSNVIHEAYSNSSDYRQAEGYPEELGESLGVISRLIKGGLGTKIYMLSISGFDTHASQSDQHSYLLENLSKSVAYFYEDLKAAGLQDKVMTMTVSEFGRRVAENGSEGTDHGTAGPIMLFGQGLKSNGFVGDYSSLNAEKLINDGRDLQHHIDFRSVYGTLLKEWMCVDSEVVDGVLGASFESLDLGFSCQKEAPVPEPEPEETEEEGETTDPITEEPTVENPEVSDPVVIPPPVVINPEVAEPAEPEIIPEAAIRNFTTYVTHANGDTFININVDFTQHVVIKLYTIGGSELGILKNDVYTSGKHQINVKMSIARSLSRGYYMYSVASNQYFTTKKFMVL